MNLDRFFSPYKTPPLTNLGDSLRHWAEYQPDTVAFYMTDGEDEELRLTYAGLLRSAEAIAADLLDRDLAGERALLLFPPGLDFVEAFFGCLLAGVTAVPAYPPRRNRNVATDSGHLGRCECPCGIDRRAKCEIAYNGILG